MTIQNFIEELKNDINIDLKNRLQIRAYIPIAEKRAIIEDVVDRSVMVESGVIQYDYVKNKIAFELAMIKYHTDCDLEIDLDSEDDYDAIEALLMDKETFRGVLTSLYRDDYYECKTIMEKMIEDLYSQNSIEASIARMASSISESVGSLADHISKKIDNFDIKTMLPQDVDLNGLMTLLNKYGK